MNRRILLTAGITGLAFASLLAATPAHAASPDSTTAPNATRFTSIDGQRVTDSPGFLTIRGGDRHPAFSMRTSKDHSAGDEVKIIDQQSGDTLCETTLTADITASCTSKIELPLGQSWPEAIVTPKGSDQADASTGDFHLNYGVDNFDVKVDSYDAAAKIAHVSGTTAPGIEVTLDTIGPSTSRQRVTSDPTTGRFTSPVYYVGARDGVRALATVGNDTPGAVSSGSEVWMPGAAPAAPKATTVVTGKSAKITVQGEDGLHATVLDVDGRTVGESIIEDDQAVITVTNAGTTVDYFVVQKTNYGLESPKTPVTLNAGVGSAVPNAPKLVTSVTSGARVAVTVSGQRGAFVIVKNTYGEPVGSRLIGASGSTQVVIPAPTDDDNNDFQVTQAVSGATSTPTSFIVAVS